MEKQRSGCDKYQVWTFRAYSISERVSVYGCRDSGIGNPMKGKYRKYVKVRGFIPVKVDDDAFD